MLCVCCRRTGSPRTADRMRQPIPPMRWRCNRPTGNAFKAWVMPMLSFVLDYDMDLEAAIHQPRIDASEGAVVIGDARLPAQVREALRARFDYEEARVQAQPMKFACPSAVLREDATNSGATEIFQPWADAVVEV